jgi:hypothetical protein
MNCIHDKLGKNIVTASLTIAFLGYFPHTYSALSRTSNPDNPVMFSPSVLAIGETVGSIAVVLLLIGLFVFFREESG